MSGSSTTKSRRGWRRGVGGGGGGDSSSSPSTKPLALARPASSAALVLRVLEDDEDESTKPSSNLPLTVVTDDFALGRVLGRGQFGTTRLATRRDSGQLFACKIILKRKLATQAAVAAVRREVAIMRRLDHPSIVKLQGAYEDDRAVHLVVELCQGGELFESIARNGKFSERCAARRARSMLETLRYLHGKGVVHRDLKPENFLLSTKDDESPIKMIDFGLSAYAREDERLSDVVGTAYYMAPEVLRGRYGHKADIWSAGVICYIMLSGMPPFRGDTERAVFRAIVDDEPEFKGAAWRHVSSAAKETIAAMLRKDPRKRPNAAELLQEFEWLEEASAAKKRMSLEKKRASIEKKRRTSIEKKRRTSIDAVAGSVPAVAAAAAAFRASATVAAAPTAAAASAASALAVFRLRSKPRPRPPILEEALTPLPPPPSPPLSSSSSSSSLEELSTPLDPAVKDSLRRFVGTDKLKRQATLLVAGRLGRASGGGGLEQMAALREACAALDAEGRGVISVDQLRDAITCVATHAGGDHGASCAVVEARRATGNGAGGSGGEAPKPATATSAAAAFPSSSSSSPPSPTNKMLSRLSPSEQKEHGGEGEETTPEDDDDDTSCGCSLSSSMCDLAAAEERELQDQRRLQQRRRQQQMQVQQQGEQLHQQLDLLQLEQHHLSSRPVSAAVSEGGAAGKPDQQQQQQLHHRQSHHRHSHHRHSLRKHDCCSELGALLREVCDEFREGCRLDYNKFVDYALQSSARVK